MVQAGCCHAMFCVHMDGIPNGIQRLSKQAASFSDMVLILVACIKSHQQRILGRRTEEMQSGRKNGRPLRARVSWTRLLPTRAPNSSAKFVVNIMIVWKQKLRART